MVVRAARSFCLAAALFVALDGCVIDAYRSVRGLDKNDPDLFKSRAFVDKTDEIWTLVRDEALKAQERFR